jgi:hypothetical protein
VRRNEGTKRIREREKEGKKNRGRQYKKGVLFEGQLVDVEVERLSET